MALTPLSLLCGPQVSELDVVVGKLQPYYLK